MNKTSLFIILLLFAVSMNGQNSGKGNTFRPVDLQTDHLENPLGIDHATPRLSWRMEDRKEGAAQKAYRLLVGTDSLQIVDPGKAAQNAEKGVNGKDRDGKEDSEAGSGLWDTGRIDSEGQLVPYAGAALKPFTKYYWKVILWDGRGRATTSAVHSFETGMMHISNWQGSWISDGRDIHHKAAPYFRKQFDVRKEIASARVYIAAAGLYELHVNGEKIGNQRLDPMYTRFDRRNLYVTHDVTTQLQQGENAVGVILGNGWYNHQSLAVWDFEKAPWRNRPAFCLDLRITYTDGSVETIPSDLSWKKSEGPIIFNSIYTGEHYDARLEQEGWSKPGFDDNKWQGVALRSAPSQNITAQQVRPIRNVRTLPAVSFRKFDDRTYLYDFGQNMAGVTRIKVWGKEGTRLRIRHGERLDEKGRLDLSNIDVYYRGDKENDPFQTDILTLSGKGEDAFMARFNYKGFRYVEVTGSEPVELDKQSLTAYFMHSDVPPIGKIETSSELINKLWRATNNAYLSNLMGYPTDCPQREKNGWTGDGHFAIETALYNFDGITVYEKWLADHRDEQQPNGVLPDIIPTGRWGYGTANGLDWTSTIAIIPWEIYRFYGDSKLLADSYDHIRRYVDYVDFFVDATILARAAKLFGKETDHLHYTALAEKIKNAINEKFLNRETGIYASGTQTELSVPLQMFGEIGAWFFKGVGGIYPDAEQPGFKHIILRPHFEKDMEHFSAEYKSPYGLIKSSWKWENNRVIYEVVVPANSSATLYLPENAEIIPNRMKRIQGDPKGNSIMKLPAGSHTFTFKVAM